MKWPILPPKNSLQRHLSLGLAIGVTGLWLLATVGAGLIIRHEIDEVFDSALREVAQRVLPLAYIEVLDRDTAAPPTMCPHSGSRRSARMRNTSPISCATPKAGCYCNPTTPILRLSRTT